jgi:hypothetical protein
MDAALLIFFKPFDAVAEAVAVEALPRLVTLAV